MWKKPWFLSQGSRVESFMSSQDRCLSHGLGSNLRGTLESRSVEGPSSLMAHQPSGDVGCISCSQKFLADLRGYHVLVHADNTLVVSYIITRGVCGHVHLQTGMPNPPVVPREVVVSSSCLHPGGPQYRSRHPVKIGAEARGMEAPPQGGGADMEAQVDLFAPRETSHCPLWFSLMHPASSKEQTGCDSADVAKALSVCIFPDRSAPERVRWERVLLLLIAPQWPGRVWFPDIYPFLKGLLWSSPSGGTFCPKQGTRYFPPTRTVETVGLASEGAQLIDTGLSTEVVETIPHSRAPSMRKMYALKWKVFTSWCSDHQLDPVNCIVGTVLEFLPDRFTAGLALSTLKVYVAAISAYHIPFDGMSLGKDPLVSRFPPWYFEAEVLQAFCPPPFRMRTRKGTICFAHCGH